MKRIEKEISRHYLLLGIFLAAFVCANLFLIGGFLGKYTDYIRSCRLIQQLQLNYNESKKQFHLYNKEREASALEQYRGSMEAAHRLMENLSEQTDGERNCRMMYRIVDQMLRHRDDVILDYAVPARGEPGHDIDYIEDLDLLLENNLNQLAVFYLDLINHAYERNVRRLRISLITLYGILILGSLAIFLINADVYERILCSIGRLKDAAQEINQRNFDGADIEETSYEEFRVVVAAFNEMKHTIRKMLQELQEGFRIKERLSEQLLENEQQRRKLVEAKMKELQMQINPHFLFNTLSLVIRSIQLEDKETSITLIRAISRILRSSIETHSLSIPLDDEIELLESYLYIQRLHLKDRVELSLDIRKSYGEEEFLVPPLIMQPLVENAIKHGLRNVAAGGRVSVSVMESTDFYELTVRDNGCGMSEEMLTQIRTGKPGKSIGLKNVKERLELLYGRNDVFTISSDGSGTSVRVLFFKRGKTGSCEGEKRDDSVDSGR